MYLALKCALVTTITFDFLVGIAKSDNATSPPIATEVTRPRVVRLYVCLSHSCAFLMPLDGMRCHLAGTLTQS